MTRSEMKPAPQMNRAYFTEGCRLYREYIFYVLAFNAVERIRKQFFFFHDAAFFLSVLDWFKTDKNKQFLCVVYEECSEVNALSD